MKSATGYRRVKCWTCIAVKERGPRHGKTPFSAGSKGNVAIGCIGILVPCVLKPLWTYIVCVGEFKGNVMKVEGFNSINTFFCMKIFMYVSRH